MPACKLWFLDGKDEKGKIVSNPNIGYGSQTSEYANGKTREFYQIGVSANTTGISVYIMGVEDKKYLAQTFGRDFGKASVTGYCIKFKTLADIKVDVLKAAIQYGIGQTNIHHLMQLGSTRCHPGNRCTLPFSVRTRHHRLVRVEVRISTEMSASRQLCASNCGPLSIP
jgi:hypothetical protein